MNKPYLVYVNGILAERRMTKAVAVKTAMKFFPSYIVDARSNAVVWTGGK